MRRRNSVMKPSPADHQIWQLHQKMADKLLANPDLLHSVRQTLEQRYQSGMMHYGHYITWDSILSLVSEPEVFKQHLLAMSEQMLKLRRKTIFVGVLTEAEREEALTGSASSNGD